MKILAFALLASLAVLPAGTFYDFTVNSIDGKPISFSAYRGKSILIVNTASKCGNTPQYADLQKVHEAHGGKLVILGFPANNFGGQEPGTNAEIKGFCSKNYGVTFQMFEKVSVKGDDQHPLYAWLRQQTGQEPTWNFCKYLIKPDGTVKFFSSRVKPDDPQIIGQL